MLPDMDPNYMLIGRILRPHGVHGEVRIEILTSIPEYFEEGTLYIGRDVRHLQAYEIDTVRFHQGKALLKLVNVTNRNDVEPWYNWPVYLPRTAATPLAEGEFFLYQLIGMAVVTETGEALGKVTDTIQTGANDVFVVNGPKGELLLPDIEEVVLSINAAERLITVRLMEGL